MSAGLLMVLLLVAAVQLVFVVDAKPPIARWPNCTDECGGVEIPYPFGMGVGCFLDHWFEIECKASSNPNGSISHKPYLANFSNLEVIEISTENYPSQIIVGMLPMNNCVAETRPSINFTGTPFMLSTMGNVLMVEGCSGSAVLMNESKGIMAGCGTVCRNSSTPEILKNGCNGVECCQTLVSSSNREYTLSFFHIDIYASPGSCLTATLISSDSADQYVGKLSDSSDHSAAAAPSVPAVLIWSWISKLNADNDSNAFCERDAGKLYCNCRGNSRGNPYVSNGCQVPPECKGCRGYCMHIWDERTQKRIQNSYYCDGMSLKKAAILGISISFGVVLLVIGLYGLYRFVKRRREIKRRAKFFKRNGGLLLNQQLTSNEGIADGTKVFTESDLDKATDHFDENRILGQGGQGTVYKGMLVDGRIVAIKKAKLLDESQLEQFINEVVILSQINHRNVVKLLGCCLETEVPLLVYEFIPNGTLFEHIHDPDEDFAINWEKRLKIVLDSACAIAYLHSSSSIPIYHRDIKSSNILLDERHRAKVSDFGSSKTIAIDQTHLTTLVQGTMGYLDPEYFQSYQFTDKSDVYSFGVVLLEILTNKKPIYRDASSTEQKNLVTEFSSLMEQSALSNILDPEVVREAKEDELMAFVELATRCISRSGKLRPTMKEVAMTLEMIIKSPAQVSTLFQQEAYESAENAITEASHAEFISNTLPASTSSTLYAYA